MCFSVSLRAAYKPFTPNLNSIFKFANFSLPFSLYSPQLKSHTNGSVIYCLLFLQRQECFHKQQSARRSRKASQFSLCTLLCHFRTKNRNSKHTHTSRKNRSTSGIIGVSGFLGKPKPFSIYKVVNAHNN